MFSEYIGAFFRILNFALLIGVFTYLFKKYALRLIQEKRAEKKMNLAHLSQKKIELDAQQTFLDQSQHQQSELRIQLLEKIKLWQEGLERERRHAIKETEVIEQTIKTHAQLRTQQALLHQLKQHFKKTEIPLMRNELREYFNDAKKNNRFIHDMIQAMEKS